MALEAVVFQQDLFGYSGGNKDFSNLVGGNWGNFDFDLKLEDEKGSSFEDFQLPQAPDHHYVNWDSPPFDSSMADHLNPNHHHQQHLNSSSSPEADNMANNGGFSPEEPPLQQPDAPSTLTRPKRRRVKCRKNQEDIENQRMTHIAVERNRRKQMNEYLSVLRSLMPDSYVQRGDQASIIGGAINFVKELEQRLQFLGTNKEKEPEEPDDSMLPFAEFFSFPQYSTAAAAAPSSSSTATTVADYVNGSAAGTSVADVEVTMVESHANIKIRTRRRSKQLLRMVSGLQTLRLTVLHLNVTTVDQIVLYCLSVKVEDDCRLSSVDEIATAVHQLLGRIQEEVMLNI